MGKVITPQHASPCFFVGGCVCVCVVPLALIMHIQTTHPKTHRATYILARGPMNAGNLVGPRGVSSLQPFSFVAFRCKSMIVFSQGGATNPHPFVAISLSRSLPAFAKTVSYEDRYNHHSCVPSLHPSLLGHVGLLYSFHLLILGKSQFKHQRANGM